MNPKYSRYYTFIKPISRNRYVKTYSSLTFSLIAILIFSLFAIKPTVTTMLVLQKNIEEQQKVLDTLSKKEQDLSLGKNNLNSLNPQIRSRIDSLLPDKTDVPSIIESLNSLSIQSQATISGLQFQPTEIVGVPNILTKNPTLTEVPINFNISGDYSKMVEALDKLSKSNRLFSVDSIRINKSSDNILVLSIGAKAYYLKN